MKAVGRLVLMLGLLSSGVAFGEEACADIMSNRAVPGREICGVISKIGVSKNEVTYLELEDDFKYFVYDSSVPTLTAAFANGLKVCLVYEPNGYWKFSSIEKND